MTDDNSLSEFECKNQSDDNNYKCVYNIHDYDYHIKNDYNNVKIVNNNYFNN